MKKDEFTSIRAFGILAAIQFVLTLLFLFLPVLQSSFSRVITFALSLFELSGAQEIQILKDLLFIIFRIPLLLFGAGYLQSRYSSSEANILTRQVSMGRYYLKNLARLYMMSLCNFVAILIALAIYLLPDLFIGLTSQDMLWLRQMCPLIILYPLSGFVLLLYVNLVTLFTPIKYNAFIGLSSLIINMSFFKMPLGIVQSWIQYSPLAAQSFNYIGKQMLKNNTAASIGIEIRLNGNVLILFASLLVQILLLSIIISKKIRTMDYLCNIGKGRLL
jgi:hypothetical protein